ncbi:MAG: diphthine--ammonia ligase [Candidatus Bathyarchaeota archaeon]|nr:diphthine--ammonia ligase [Candidatus Bathyarchaeota archaeon]MCX8176678.1 diphthine--ammonia ligase [Candidatus Bathyarchaeota archaeon]MDW8193205.1 diphthine--ammonia ligase [Nitrososphaerota archaeon]
MRVVVSWSGGKDSCLAYQKALTQGHEICGIVTFLWENPSHAHPLCIVELQAKALKTKHFKAETREPYFEHYKNALLHLTENEGIEAIVTGDIAPLDAFHGNWMDSICKELGIEVIKPLWGIDRYQILKELISQGCKAVFSCVKKPWFNENWLGRELTWEAIEELKTLRDRYGIDLCGENGEYHTLIIDAPILKETIEISKYDIERHNGAFYMKIVEASLKPKTNWK